MKRNQSVEEKRIRNIINRKCIILCIIFLVFIEIGYLYSFFGVPQVYQSTTRLLFIPEVTSEVEKSSLKASARPTSMNVYRKRVKQSDILKQVIQNLELEVSENELADQIQVKVENDTYIIAISVIDRNPEQAMKIAQEIANVFLQKMKETYHFEQIGVIDQAKLPTKSSNTHYQHMILFGAFGLLVSAMYIAVVYHWDNTIKTEQEIEEYMNLSVLGAVPKEPDTEDWARNVCRNLVAQNKKRKAKTFVFTSMLPQEGTTYIASNVAEACAKAEQKVLFLDCNVRKEDQSPAFRVSGKKGLTEYADALTGTPSKDFTLAKKFIKETKIPNLHILTNGTLPQNPADFLRSARMKRVLAIAKYLYDIVIIDLPACQDDDDDEISDHLILTSLVDSVILIVKTGETKIRDLQDRKDEIECAEGTVFGCVVNHMETTTEQEIDEDDDVDEIEEIEEESEKSEEEEDLAAEQNASATLTVAAVVKEASKRFKKEKNPEKIFPDGEIQPKANREEMKQQTEKILEQVEEFEERIATDMKKPMAKLVNQKVELFETLQRARMANRQKKQKDGEMTEDQEKIEQDFLDLKQGMKDQIQDEVATRFQANLEKLEDWNEEWLECLTIRQKEALMKKLEKKEEAIQRRLQKELMQHLQTKMKENKQPAKRGRKKKVPESEEAKQEA